MDNEKMRGPSWAKTRTDMSWRSDTLPATVWPTIEDAGLAEDKAVLVAFPICEPDVVKDLHDLLQQSGPMLGRLSHHNASPVMTEC